MLEKTEGAVKNG